ncbi:MAG: mechanosensitive ion channel family protein [Anaerolineae bacterium]|nr:mechanosensitive ion channel family protein [Gemmatimonadaceae bacterium]
MSEFLNRSFHGNALSVWLSAAAIVALIAVPLSLGKRFALSRLTHFAKRTRTRADDLVVELLLRSGFVFLVWLTLLVALEVLQLKRGDRSFLRGAAVITFLVQAGIWLNGVIAFWVNSHLAERAASDSASVTTIKALSIGARVFLWAVIFVLALDNLGVDIATLVAGLGITGIAVALAVQNILGDVFAALSIVLDKPFVVGDQIQVDTFAGTVEHIGLKSTRVRSVSGEQIIFSNADLLKGRVRNFKRMYERRIQLLFGISYGTTVATSAETLARIPGIVREAIEAQPHTRFERSHFRGYGESALEFESVYFVSSPDFNLSMDVQQAVNLRVFERFSEEGIEFSFPTSVVIHKGVTAAQNSLAGVVSP